MADKSPVNEINDSVHETSLCQNDPTVLSLTYQHLHVGEDHVYIYHAQYYFHFTLKLFQIMKLLGIVSWIFHSWIPKQKKVSILVVSNVLDRRNRSARYHSLLLMECL